MTDQTLDEMDAEIRAKSLAAMPEEFRLLDDLILLMNNGTALVSGVKHDRGLNMLAGILIGKAFNSLWRAREELICGYPIQSMALGRAALEDWATLLWVELHPKNVNMFLWAIYDEIDRPNTIPPKFDKMWKEFGDLGTIPSTMYDNLSKFAHPKSIGFRWLLEFDEVNTTFHYGPNFNEHHLKVVLFHVIQIAQTFGERVARLQHRMLGKVNDAWLEQSLAVAMRAQTTIDLMYLDFGAALRNDDQSDKAD